MELESNLNRNYGLFWLIARGWKINLQSLLAQTGPIPLVSNVRCMHFLNSLIFWGPDWKALTGLMWPTGHQLMITILWHQMLFQDLTWQIKARV